MNVELSYLYRDAGNYKQYNTEVFTNKASIPLSEIKSKIKEALIEGEWFYVDKWGLRDLHFDTWDNQLDHTWHEFDEVEETEKPSTKGDVLEFLHLLLQQ